ncbi:LysR family transcriptional regulator [Shewanella halotolerans]|uniref:LysR family transcriptional regulator n=1 Tax=Shewanella halotolerans TaxID=2864204 RepID=UPI001C65A15F|nr:LysR family transcriptional regulator [Shewanella halotolerans]QYJ91542.1 LysR family transcriptional regulator [Shewanella halotolerans]
MDIYANIPLFVSVVELGSFSEAARRLGINKSAVSKRISALEQALGVKLIQRTTRRLHLTDAGRQYYEYVHQAAALMQQAQDALASQQGAVKGNLKVSLPNVFGQRHIAPLLSEFSRQYPAINLEVSLDDRVVDLLKEGLDMVVRIGDLPDSSLVALKLAPCHSLLCTSPDYLARQGHPRSLADLRGHNCLFYSYFRGGLEWSFERRGEVSRIKPRGNIKVNNSEVIRRLLLDGMGIALMPRYLVEEELAAGTLVPVLSDYQAPTHGIYALTPERLHIPARLRVFIDFLKQALAERSANW